MNRTAGYTCAQRSWAQSVTRDTKSDAYAEVDAVACVEVTSEQMVKECTGYTRDDHDTNNEVTLKSATYTVAVRASTTGKVLGTAHLDGTDDTCPTIMTFDDDDDQTKTYDAPPSTDDLIAFVKPFVQP